MKPLLKPLLNLLLGLWLFASPGHADGIMLATPASETLQPRHYLVSEKLDGVRARWTGSALLSRRGNPIHAPAWFTAALPAQALDGELWIGRGEFQATTRIVLDTHADDAGWRQVRLMVFDLPEHTGPFAQRAEAIEALIARINAPHVAAVTQFRISDEQELQQKLAAVEALGGEGLMLQHQDNLYRDGRNHGLLKYKSFADAEARVIGYRAGKGKYQGMVGALEVENAAGVRFRLGSGLSDAERRDPPPIGSLVTYKFHGLTDSGKPRFASFLRIRALPTEIAE